MAFKRPPAPTPEQKLSTNGVPFGAGRSTAKRWCALIDEKVASDREGGSHIRGRVY